MKLAKLDKYKFISQRQRLSPFPNYYSMACICQEMKRVVGVAYQEVWLFFQGNNTYLYMRKDDHERVGRKVLNKVLANPAIFVELLGKQKRFARDFYKFIKSHNSQVKLKKYSNQKLAKLQQEYERRYRQVYSHYFPILSVEDYLFEYLRSYIFSLEKDVKKAAKYIDLLITEKKAMVNTQEQLAALKAAVKIKKNKKWLSCFGEKNVDLILSAIKKHPKLFRIFKRHYRNFFWITRNYEDPVLTPEDFVVRFKKILRTNPEKTLSRIYRSEEKLKNDVKKIISRLKIDRQHQRLFQTMREGIYYKEFRKWVVSKSLYFYDPILKEIAKRVSLSLGQLRFMTTAEITEALLSEADFTELIQERMKLSLFYSNNRGVQVLQGKRARKYFNHFVRINPRQKLLPAMPVVSGTAKGPVKIVMHNTDFKKVKKGNIIVTLQATPEFSPILNIAAGLVCDGGPGVTSHPATLAREAGIPAVIKAQIATKILKDGEIVEVDGNKGIVKRLNK